MTGDRGTILTWPWPPDSSADYVGMVLAAAIDAGWRVAPLDRGCLGSVVRRDASVVHLHWPEHGHVEEGVRGRIRAVVRLGLATVARLRRIPVLWTVHNLAPHERTVLGRALYRWAGVVASDWVTLSRAGAAAVGAARVVGRGTYRGVVPHPRYRVVVTPPPAPRYGVGLIGSVREYKGTLAALDVLADAGVSVLVAGARSSEADREGIDRLVTGAANVHDGGTLGSVADYQEAVLSCRLVLLPYLAGLHSGAALHALSLGRPVLVRDTPVAREWRALVGSGWIKLLPEGPITAGAVETAVAESWPTDQPDLRWFEDGPDRMLTVIEAVAAAARGRS